MAYFIDKDGKTVLRWRVLTDTGIMLENGKHLPDEDVVHRIFSVHPDESKFVEKIEGIYHYNGKSLKEEDDDGK